MPYGRIFTLCTVCMIMDGFDVQALGYVAPTLVREWQVAPSLLGPVFGAANFGVLLGQLLFTMLADKIGRRPVLIGGTLFFALATLATARVDTIGELLAIRFIAGTGMGSIIPNATALVGEFSPPRMRVALMTWLSVGFTAGAALGGFVAAWLIPGFGWRSVFYVGGAVPLALSVVMVIWLKESPEFLAGRERRPGVPAVYLFREGRAATTLLLWVVNFMNLFNLFSLANWLPTVVARAGYATSTAVLIGTLLQVGGTISPFVLTWLIVRHGFVAPLAGAFVIATISVALIGYPGLSLALLAAIVFIAGATIVGSQPSLNALAGTFYPTSLRSTGVGWALGIGRAGSIVGPVLAGQFLALKWTTQDIFLALAIPALIATIAMASLSRSLRTVSAARY
jgi:AAHS family 4-hydroxybenzoate transporter-like MFS transporter